METQGRLRHVYAFKINRKVAKFRHGMARVEKTVFISYRRTNAPWALPSSRTCTTTDMTYFLIMKASPSGDFESVILGNIRGNARKAKGDVEGALQDYNEVIRLKPDYANAYYNRAGILIRFCLF